jgi:hypothetical protein
MRELVSSFTRRAGTAGREQRDESAIWEGGRDQAEYLLTAALETKRCLLGQARQADGEFSYPCWGQ